jgi:tetratricopeptide (TPR) repeat protein
MMIQRNKRNLIETVHENREIPVCLGLDADHLDLILRETIPRFSIDKELIAMAQFLSMQLSSISEKELQHTEYVLEQIASILETFLSSTDALPPAVVAYVHTYLGLIDLQLKQHSSAINHLLKALWIRTSAHEPEDHIAVASHRLALAYGAALEFSKATSLLQRALQQYDEARVPRDHLFVKHARKSLEKYDSQRELVQQARIAVVEEGAPTISAELRCQLS